MARVVKRTRGGPYPVTVGGETKYICGCGLSNTQPFCNGTHKISREEDPTSSIGTTSKATASKPLTVSRVFAVHKNETGSHDARSVLSAYRLGTD
jgi:CDGSH-type Zn-finger protein